MLIIIQLLYLIIILSSDKKVSIKFWRFSESASGYMFWSILQRYMIKHFSTIYLISLEKKNWSHLYENFITDL